MISGTFIIDVRCRPISRIRAVTFRDRVSTYLSEIDPYFSLEEKHFAGLQYVFTWSGIPLALEASQKLFHFLKHNTSKYLSSYKISFKIDLHEKGF